MGRLTHVFVAAHPAPGGHVHPGGLEDQVSLVRGAKVKRVFNSDAHYWEKAGPVSWDGVLKPGAIEAFEVAVAAGKLTSPREGLDKNMYKALKVQEFPDILPASGIARAGGIVIRESVDDADCRVAAEDRVEIEDVHIPDAPGWDDGKLVEDLFHLPGHFGLQASDD